ncbi:MAG: hypothetical protein ACE145_04110 [Terriglobia bacterium]
MVVAAGRPLWAQDPTSGQKPADKKAASKKTAEGKPEEAKPAEEPAAEQKAAEEPASEPAPEPNSTKTFGVRNGTFSYSRTEETERKKTRDGEVETQRLRMPAFGGDHRVVMEREVRTKKLPDGTIEKEYVLRNPDGSDRMVPIEITRERIKKSGDSTSIEREVLKPDYSGRWTPVRKEHETAAGPEAARTSTKETREKSMSGDWRLVDRQTTTEKSAEGKKETQTVRQVPDAYGRMADYEVRQEKVSTTPGKETREVTLRRRDFQDTINPKSYLVERTVSEQVKTPEGKATVKTTKESDLVAGGAARDVSSFKPRVVEEKTQETAPGKDGSTQTVERVKERGAADSELRPSYQVVQETDRSGHVRQVFVTLR